MNNIPKSGDVELSKNIFLTTYISDVGTNEPYKIDIINLVQEIQIFESINESTLAGVMTIVDAAGVLDRLPITGNEVLEFQMHSPQFTPDTKSPRGYDFTMTSGFPMWVTNIKNISQPNPGVKIYALEFHSKERVKDTQRKLSRAFAGTISESVKTVIRSYLKSEKDLFYEPTSPVVKYVIPKKSPLSTIKFLSKEAISEKFSNSGFFFWETSDGFHFKSLESMISTPAGVSKKPMAEYSNAPKIQSGMMYKTKVGNTIKKGNNERVYEYKVLSRFNTLQNISRGVYASKLVTYNGFTKQFKDIEFSYPHEFTRSNHMGQISSDKTSVTNGLMPIYNYEDNKLLSDFSEGKYMFTSSTNGLHDHLVDKIDESGQFVYKQGTYNPIKEKTIEPYETSDIEQTLQKGISQRNAFNSFTIELVVPGNTAITAGSVISFSTLTNSGSKESTLDPYMSGNYLVTEVRHIVQKPKNATHTMTLVCAKDSVSRPYNKNDKETLNKEKGKGLDINQFEIDTTGMTLV